MKLFPQKYLQICESVNLVLCFVLCSTRHSSKYINSRKKEKSPKPLIYQGFKAILDLLKSKQIHANDVPGEIRTPDRLRIIYQYFYLEPQLLSDFRKDIILFRSRCLYVPSTNPSSIPF